VSKLFGYGPGELLDRISILELKIAHAERATGTHFHVEQSACWAELHRRFWTAPETPQQLEPRLQQQEYGQRLFAVNRELWKREDEMRRYRRGQEAWNDRVWCHTVARCAIATNTLNAERAELVAAINRAAGILGAPEKVEPT
jgi:hypothetical protein